MDIHRVQSGDTFSSLALMYYGGERYTQFLIDTNPQIHDPNRLNLGAEIRIPPLPDAAKASTSGAPTARPASPTAGQTTGAHRRTAAEARTYRVKPGDTFYGIARDELGAASRWKELFELNRQMVNGDPKQLQVGQVLTLPKS